MELHKITWLGGIFGLFVVIISVIKWFFMTYYLSKLMFGAGIGLTIIIFSYLFELLDRQRKYRNNDERRLTELEFWAREKGFER